jgi:hypothetical protein
LPTIPLPMVTIRRELLVIFLLVNIATSKPSRIWYTFFSLESGICFLGLLVDMFDKPSALHVSKPRGFANLRGAY